MVTDDSLTIRYGAHPRVTELIDLVTYCAESISLGFDRWDDAHVRGPGLYFVVLAGTSIAEYADPMGDNLWPVENCRVVTADGDAFFQAARTVAMEGDGAVVVSVDGYVHEQMVRLKDLSSEELGAIDADEAPEYAEWMGARHMSALDTSIREAVVAAITLSEEDGRVTTFRDGNYETSRREQLGGDWRRDE